MKPRQPEHGLGLDDEDGVALAGPEARNHYEQGAVSPGQVELATARTSPEDGHLMTQREDLGFQGCLRPKQITKDADQQPQHRAGAFLQAEARSMIVVRT